MPNPTAYRVVKCESITAADISQTVTQMTELWSIFHTTPVSSGAAVKWPSWAISLADVYASGGS